MRRFTPLYHGADEGQMVLNKCLEPYVNAPIGSAKTMPHTS